MPKVGDKISFVPSAFFQQQPPHAGHRLQEVPHRVKATICYVNEAHNWFRAAFEIFGQTQYECFKF